MEKVNPDIVQGACSDEKERPGGTEMLRRAALCSEQEEIGEKVYAENMGVER